MKRVSELVKTVRDLFGSVDISIGSGGERVEVQMLRTSGRTTVVAQRLERGVFSTAFLPRNRNGVGSRHFFNSSE